MDLLERYQKLVALGIDSSANLPDLNDMTDRGANALKPWTAYKTVGTMALINNYGITDEETLLNKFQEHSKIRIEDLTDYVYNNQAKYFGNVRYDKDIIFKYAYCCIIVNSLKGHATESVFDRWSHQNSIIIKMPNKLLDEKFHTDRIEVDANGKIISFISIKPHLFSINFLQYTDVFAGLQVLTYLTGIPWKIYYRDGESFNLIQLSDLSEEIQNTIKNWANGYSKDEIDEIKPVLKEMKI